MSTPVGERPAMADYGVNRDDWTALPWSWAAQRLAATRNFWVTTAALSGQPHSMPVWGVWDDDDLQFMFSCSPNAKKARNLLANPRVAFTTDNSVECVSLQGTAALLSDPARIDIWVDRYLAKYGEEMGPEAGGFIRAHAVFEVTPTQAVALIERADEFDKSATRWRLRR